MHKVQKTYTPECKREAVRLAQTSGKPIAQVARKLGISDTSIHQWRKELAEHDSEAFPGSGHQIFERYHRCSSVLDQSIGEMFIGGTGITLLSYFRTRTLSHAPRVSKPRDQQLLLCCFSSRWPRVAVGE
jgi:transposase